VADPTQTLQRDLLDRVEVWPDIETAQAAVDAFRHECNTVRPYQSLDMAFPADLFIPRAADERLPLRLPRALSAATSEARQVRDGAPTFGRPQPGR
jgi:hypothetical protein